ncbi:MAG: hypothetical protein A3F74_14180 [Betaproteobacteria bacterium RIFCSPLOWO2_12_FULL_62_58]|nr:MAG: hypothetical protein A3F74_14180 [Betaproteobacteria bacterium RIFCSPLOWO2_12_FULL_62_58]
MEITRYRFGEIEIDGRTYTADVIIMPERVVDTWWRKQGHNLAVADLAEIIAAKPEILIVGTGYYGRMTIPDETRRYLQAQSVRLREAHTREAVEEFNRLQRESARIVAALHLTC